MTNIETTGRNQAGGARKRARDAWNMQELNIAHLLEEYDVDHSGQLDRAEFSSLLEDFNEGEAPTKDELEWLMKVADKNHDNLISGAELTVAMKSWEGYTHMSSEFSHMFEQFDADHNGSLDLTEFQELLTSLNGGKEVSMAQAQEVIQHADVMGDGKIGRFELEGAVGSWYMAVGRKPTPEMDVAVSTAQNNPAQNQGSMLINFLIGVIFLSYGIMYRDSACSKPLATLLQVSGGCALIAVLGSVLILCLSKRSPRGTLVKIVCAVVLLSVLARIIVNIMGLVMTLQTGPTPALASPLPAVSIGLAQNPTTTPLPSVSIELAQNPITTTCDANLYDASWWLFVFLFILSVSIMVCMCCCACMFFGMLFKNSSRNEALLQEMHEGGQGENAALMKNMA